jgi:hypothetical protein
VVGRHSAPSTSDGGASRGQEIVAWGAFTVPLAVVTLLVAGAGELVAAGVGALGLVAFSVVWAATRLVGTSAPRAEEPPAA